MKLTCHITICFLVIVLGYTKGDAQSYNNGLVSLTNGIDYSFEELNIEGNEVSYKISVGSSFTSISLEQVDIIQVAKGNYAGKYALFGGLTGLVGSSLGVWQTNTELGDLRDKSNDGAIIGGITIVTAIIGGIIGLNKKKYKRIYPNSNSISKRWKPKIDFQDNSLSAGVSFRF